MPDVEAQQQRRTWARLFLLVTRTWAPLHRMSCNPAMGGVAKGQIVREIDAMGGYSGIITDKTSIQFRMLNLSKALQCGAPGHKATVCVCRRMATGA